MYIKKPDSLKIKSQCSDICFLTSGEQDHEKKINIICNFPDLDSALALVAIWLIFPLSVQL